MFDRERLERTIDLQERSYQLLQWLNRGLTAGKTSLSTIHHATGFAASTRVWLERNHSSLPPALRPTADDIDAYSNLLASYLQTSFEVVTGTLTWGGPCNCMLCLYTKKATFLKPRKLTPRDKDDAQALKIIYLEHLSTAANLPLLRRDFEPLLPRTDALAHALSLTTYVQELMRRSEFASQGPSVLVLWREIAWENHHPRQDFKLDADSVLDAEQRILTHLQALAAME